VAVVSTILVSRAHGGVSAFHAAFWVIFVVAVLGAVTAAIAFPRGGTRRTAPEPAPSRAPLVRQQSQETVG
jgi:hypothetical protein